MPNAAPRPCPYAGCPTLVEGGGLCAEHRHTRRGNYDTTRRRQEPALAMAARIRNSARWRCIRVATRHRWPICCDPFSKGCQQATAEINHIEPLEIRPDLAYYATNHAPVCHGCHARVSAMERKKESTVHLFAGWRARNPLHEPSE